MQNWIVWILLVAAAWFILDSLGGWAVVKKWLKRIFTGWREEIAEIAEPEEPDLPTALSVVQKELGVLDAVQEAERIRRRDALKAIVEESLAMIGGSQTVEKTVTTVTKARKSV